MFVNPSRPQLFVVRPGFVPILQSPHVLTSGTPHSVRQIFLRRTFGGTNSNLVSHLNRPNVKQSPTCIRAARPGRNNGRYRELFQKTIRAMSKCCDFQTPDQEMSEGVTRVPEISERNQYTTVPGNQVFQNSSQNRKKKKNLPIILDL